MQGRAHGGSYATTVGLRAVIKRAEIRSLFAQALNCWVCTYEDTLPCRDTLPNMSASPE